MSRPGRLRRAFGRLLALPVLLPLLALGMAALVDRGPDGGVRATPFLAVLTLFDPQVTEAVAHSLLVAAVVTGCSLILGVQLARVIARWRFWGRPPLAFLCLAPMVIPPAFAALGLRVLVGTENLSPRVPGPFPWLQPWNGRIGGAWIAFVGVEIIAGVPVVAMAVIRALRRIEPGWEEAGRAVSDRPRHVWRTLVWPLVRSEAWRASGVVFGLALLDPGAPLVLNLRRTLGFQLVESVATPGPPARAAVLALVGLVLALTGRLVLRTRRHLSLSGPVLARPKTATWRRWPLLVLTLAAWSALAWLPLMALFGLPWLDPADGGMTAGARSWLGAVRGQPGAGTVVAVSLVIGAIVAGLDLALAALFTSPPLQGRPSVRAAVRLASRVPPLVLAIGLLALAWDLEAVADWLPGGGGWGALRSLCRMVSGWIDPRVTPGVALVFALSVVHLPMIGRVAASTRARYHPELIEAAETLGASPTRAWRDVVGPLVVPTLLRLGLLTAVLAASDVAMAVVLTPSSLARPVGPAILLLAEEPEGLPAATGLGALIVLANLAALGLAYRDEPPLDGGPAA